MCSFAHHIDNKGKVNIGALSCDCSICMHISKTNFCVLDPNLMSVRSKKHKINLHSYFGDGFLCLRSLLNIAKILKAYHLVWISIYVFVCICVYVCVSHSAIDKVCVGISILGEGSIRAFNFDDEQSKEKLNASNGSTKTLGRT